MWSVAKKKGVTRAEYLDAFNIALVVGGSIVIPHLRRAVERLDELEGLEASPNRFDAADKGGDAADAAE
jgi:hypothetical protein